MVRMNKKSTLGKSYLLGDVRPQFVLSDQDHLPISCVLVGHNVLSRGKIYLQPCRPVHMMMLKENLKKYSTSNNKKLSIEIEAYSNF